MWLWCNVSTVIACGLGQGPETSAAGHPFRPARGHGAVARATRGGQSKRRPTPRSGGQTIWRPRARVASELLTARHLGGPGRGCGPFAQPVVDQREQLAGRGDLGDGSLPRAGLDPLAIKGDLGGCRAWRWNGLHGPAPPHKLAALFGDVARRRTTVSDSRCVGVKPGPSET